MEQKVLIFNKLLDNYFDFQIKDKQKVQISRDLIALSERGDFIDIALSLLSTLQLTSSKILLASCMIKDKFRYDFQLLNPEKIINYYNILCQTAAKFGTANKAIFYNVSQSLALIYLNQITISDFSLSQFLQRFAPNDTKQLCLYNYYFKVLEECPQVAINSKIVLQDQSRKKAKQRLISQQIQIIEILNLSVEDVWYHPIISSQVDKINIIECFENWIDLYYDPQIYNSLHTTALLRQTFASLRDQNLIEKASCCVKVIIENMKSPQQNPQLYQYIGTQIHQLLPYIDEQLARGQMFIAQELIQLVVFFSMKSKEVLVNNYSENVSNYLMSLIRYMNTNLQKVVQTLFQFWQDILQLFVKSKSECKQSIDLKIDIPIALLHAFTKQIKYPPPFIKELDAVFEDKLGSHHQQGQQIYNYRKLSQNSYMYLVQLMGPNQYAQYIMEMISEIKCLESDYFSEFQSWLFGLVSAFQKFEQVNNTIVIMVQLYERLIKNTTVPVIVSKTFLKLFKAIFAISIQDCNLVNKLYCFTIKSFSDYLLIDLGSETFYRACKLNPHFLYNHLVQIFQVVQKYPLQDYICRGYICLASYHKTTANAYIFECLQYLLNFATLKVQSKKQYIGILSVTLKEINQLDLNFKHQLFIEFIRKAWNLIVDTLKSPKSYTEDEDLIVQRMVRLLKLLMRILKQNFIEFLLELFAIANACFKKYPVCSYLYLVEIAITVYSAYPQLKEFLKNLYSQFTESAFKHLSTPQSIDRYCYLIDDFLGMNSRLLIYNASIVVSSSHFSQLLKFITTDCLQTTSTRAMKANYSFLQTLFLIFWSKQFIQAERQQKSQDTNPEQNIQPIIENQDLYMDLNIYLMGQLPMVLKSMLQHLSQIPPENTKNQILDSILASIKAFPEASAQIWEPILDQISPSILLQSEKERFIHLLQGISQLSNYPEKLQPMIKSIDRYLCLISRRMETAQKRRKFTFTKD